MEQTRVFITGFGEDSHAFTGPKESKPLVLAGVEIEDCPGLLANSDGDLIFHAVCNALASLAGLDPVLGPPADQMCKAGIKDSAAYLERQLADLRSKPQDYQIHQVAVSIEAKRPYLYDRLPDLRAGLAASLGLAAHQVGITATSGEGLTAAGQGLAMTCRVLVSASRLAEEEL